MLRTTRQRPCAFIDLQIIFIEHPTMVDLFAEGRPGLTAQHVFAQAVEELVNVEAHFDVAHGHDEAAALSCVRLAAREGLPVLFIKDLPPASSVDLEVTRPEIYYGELSNDHVFSTAPSITRVVPTLQCPCLLIFFS